MKICFLHDRWVLGSALPKPAFPQVLRGTHSLNRLPLSGPRQGRSRTPMTTISSPR